jgi:hypothetical protein
MSPEILNLLIGAAIVLLTSIISHFLQLSRDNQAKKWEMEKQQHEDNKVIIIKRLETLELEIKGLIQEIQSAFNALRIAVFLQPPNIKNLKENPGNQLTSFLEKQIELQTNSSYFRDQDLLNKIDDIYDILERYFDLYNKIIESAEEIENDNDRLLSIREEINNFGVEIAMCFANVYVKLDMVRINALESMQGIKKMDEAMTKRKKS